MAISRRNERALIRENYINLLTELLMAHDEDVLRVKSNEIAFPVVGCEGNEDFVVVTVKVPTGANKGLEPYDGYEMAEDYAHHLKEKELKAQKRAEEKAKKIARDKELRKAKEKASE